MSVSPSEVINLEVRRLKRDIDHRNSVIANHRDEIAHLKEQIRCADRAMQSVLKQEREARTGLRFARFYITLLVVACVLLALMTK